MIENVIGTFELPLGVAGYFQLNGKDVLVPMAVEEPSVVAAASFMAKLARECGGFETSSTAPLMRAQVQVLGLTDPHGARQSLLRRRQEIIDRRTANSRCTCLLQRQRLPRQGHLHGVVGLLLRIVAVIRTFALYL